MSSKTRSLALAAAFAAAAAAPSAFATYGYFSHGYSLKEKSLAGAGIALPQDSIASANNPAGMVVVGNRLDVGAALFSPIREYTVTGGPSAMCAGPSCTFSVGPQSIESDNNLFLIPHFGYNKMLDADSSVGISIYANGGMNTRYDGGTATFFIPPPGPGFVTAPGTYGGGLFGNSKTGVDLAQLFFNVSYARKLNANNSVGVSGVLAYQLFEARGLGAFAPFSSDPSKLTDNQHDNSTGFGLKVGWLGQITPAVSLAAQYQSKINMSEFGEYKGLFAGKGDFDIPPTATVGLAVKTTPTSYLAVDITKIWYSKVDSVGNPIEPLMTSCVPNFTGGPATGSGCLGASGGAGFGWRDMTIYKLGYQWETSPDWTWRVGYGTGKQPIPSSEVLFNILAPGVVEDHVTFGFTKKTGSSSELTFAAMFAPSTTVKGPNPFDPAQTIELQMKQYEVGASWGKRF